MLEEGSKDVKRPSLMEFDGDLFKKIKGLPYYRIREKLCSESMVNELLSISHSQIIMDILGFDYVKLDVVLEESDVFHC